jgi:hypothetical protein
MVIIIPGIIWFKGLAAGAAVGLIGAAGYLVGKIF